ncbi:acyl-CoA thioesterase II [Nocardioides marmoriginsengisoli]|uniref:Acyl-CoA thioesterase II n=1 Tax=Nocardioides marmoriginsengisoli TaxID=661483 RepID=A0A3N0CHK0_9ACTN|nr:acyl-CoA thioesterase domain-containing protein [Nocardioides marmoriginsengisoli]RNL62934.1 acyl-CoA thioesterase II [Nocardioides marmoriginsengisoli]
MLTGPTAAGDLLDLLQLEKVEEDTFRANYVFDEDWPLYGGQVAAQALLAAGLTVPDGRHPHSLHGYFLRRGDASRPTLFKVDRDRDGGSFSARRVVAIQRGEVIFSTSTSFAAPVGGMDLQAPALPEVTGPEESVTWVVPRMFSMEATIPPEDGVTAWPARFWSRFTTTIGDDVLLNAAALTYLTDVSADLHSFQTDGFVPAASLDHAVWFHHPGRMDDWVFTDFSARVISGNRGLYTGSIFDRSGRVVASMAQEALYRKFS